MITQRTNDEWLADLQADGSARADALNDLRVVLLNGLRHGLTNHVNTAGLDFDALAEDFVQEALLKILANLHSFKGNSKFTTWAHKIAIRVGLSELRRKRWKDRSLDEMISADTPFTKPFASSDPSPEKSSLQNDLMATIQRIIQEELTDKQRQAMLLVPIGGVPMDEAAERMGMKRNAIYKLMYDARLRLKNRLVKEGLSPTEILSAFE